MKWKAGSFSYFEDDVEVASLAFPFVSERHAEHGALFGVHIAIVANNKSINEFLSSIDLSYPAKNFPIHLFFRSSMEYTEFQNLPKSGVLSVFENSSLSEIAETISSYIMDSIFDGLAAYLRNDASLYKMIIKNPDRYKYPAAQIAFNMYKNGYEKQEVENALIKSKIYGGKPNQVNELLSKIY